jgi:uncharacterized protein YyaL (SSP411 family)
MNRLKNETSPYLLQHADNPVDWYPWGEEALARARKEQKPILLSLGYSTCHWCHVMERESFEDDEVAAYMNANFVNIKVDREERPDVDLLYMQACEVLTGRGGWPLNMFLTPDGAAFHGGTYFPPNPNGRQQSWFQALQYAAYNFYENFDAVSRKAKRTMERVKNKDTDHLGETTASTHPYGEQQAMQWLLQLQKQYDRNNGGFGQGKKFPNTMALQFMLHYAWLHADIDTLGQLKQTVDVMLRRGLYDPIGGGFYRYTVDPEWRVPHFEKMLYDNALLVQFLADLYKWKRQPAYKRAIVQTLAFLEDELERDGGGCFAALDAESKPSIDTPAKEGAYYTWTLEELSTILGDEAPLVAAYYQATPEGNWEGTNILWAQDDDTAFAEKHNITPDQLIRQLANARNHLAEARKQRPAPHRDEKVILSWNAMLVSAYAKAYQALGDASYREKAVFHLQFLLENLLGADQHQAYRTFTNGKAKGAAFLEDYAFLIQALIDVYSITLEGRYVFKAGALADYCMTTFEQKDQVLFSYSSSALLETVTSPLWYKDGELPAANAIMAISLQQLGILLNRADFRQRSAQMLEAVQPMLDRSFFPVSSWGLPALYQEQGLPEIAVVGPEAIEKVTAIQAQFIGLHTLAATTTAEAYLPILEHRWKVGETFIYICKDYACQRPITDVEELFCLL